MHAFNYIEALANKYDLRETIHFMSKFVLYFTAIVSIPDHYHISWLFLLGMQMVSVSDMCFQVWTWRPIWRKVVLNSVRHVCT